MDRGRGRLRPDSGSRLYLDGRGQRDEDPLRSPVGAFSGAPRDAATELIVAPAR